jgi:hypothetical protein
MGNALLLDGSWLNPGQLMQKKVFGYYDEA